MPNHPDASRHRSPSTRLAYALLLMLTLVLSLVAGTHAEHNAASHHSLSARRGPSIDSSSSDHDHLIQKRTLTWEDAVNRGRNFYLLLNAATQQVIDPQDPYNYVEQAPWSPQHLRSYGWTGTETSVGALARHSRRPFRFPDEALAGTWNRNPRLGTGIQMGSRQEVDNVVVKSWKHDRDTTIPAQNGQPAVTYKATGARYRAAYAFDRGIVSSFDAISPFNTRVGNNENEPLVPLHHWSDVIFLTLLEGMQQRIAQDPEARAELNMIIRESIATPETKDIIFQAIGRPPFGNPGPPEWNFRCDFRMEVGAADFENINLKREAFYALLGTPHGEGVARLILERKETFSTTRLKSITVFHHEAPPVNRFDRETSRPTLIFELSQHEDPDSDSEGGSGSSPAGNSPDWSAANTDAEAGASAGVGSGSESEGLSGSDDDD
ncbi:hypothetical protein MBLNU230_g6140t1 [Neophaeotheca triangularis]